MKKTYFNNDNSQTQNHQFIQTSHWSIYLKNTIVIIQMLRICQADIDIPCFPICFSRMCSLSGIILCVCPIAFEHDSIKSGTRIPEKKSSIQFNMLIDLEMVTFAPFHLLFVPAQYVRRTMSNICVCVYSENETIKRCSLNP